MDPIQIFRLSSSKGMISVSSIFQSSIADDG